MSKKLTIQQLTEQQLKRLKLKSNAGEIKRAYQRNLKHRRSSGRVSPHLIADQITQYLLLNNMVSELDRA